MRRIHAVLVVSVLMLSFVGFLLLVTGCAKKEPEVYKIGAMLPLTGGLSFLGDLEKNGMILAEEKINQSHMAGRNVQIVIEDTKGQAKEAVSIANKFVNVDGIQVLFSSTTTPTYAVEPIATSNSILLVGLCMDPVIQQKSQFVFRLYESMAQEAEMILSYFAKTPEVRKIGILYVRHPGTEQELNNYLLPGFEKQGKEAVVIEPYELSQKDFKNPIAKMRAAEVDHIVIIGYGFLYPNIFKELKQQDLLNKVTIVGGWGFIAPNKTPVEYLEGVIVAAPEYVFKKNAKSQSFADAYQTKYGDIPNFDAAFAYDAVMIVASGMRKSGYNPAKLAEVLSSMGTFEGVMGTVSISKEGDLSVPMGLGITRDGTVVPFSF